MIDGETGFLVAPSDPDAMAEKAEKILSDDKLAENMGMTAAEHAKRFSLEHQVDEFLDFYQEVIEDWKKR